MLLRCDLRGFTLCLGWLCLFRGEFGALCIFSYASWFADLKIQKFLSSSMSSNGRESSRNWSMVPLPVEKMNKLVTAANKNCNCDCILVTPSASPGHTIRVFPSQGSLGVIKWLLEQLELHKKVLHQRPSFAELGSGLSLTSMSNWGMAHLTWHGRHWELQTITNVTRQLGWNWGCTIRA